MQVLRFNSSFNLISRSHSSSQNVWKRLYDFAVYLCNFVVFKVRTCWNLLKAKFILQKQKNNWLPSCICLKLQFYIIILNLRIFKPCVDKLQDCFNNINIRIMYVIKFDLYKRNKIYMISLKMQMTTPPPPHKKNPTHTERFRTHDLQHQKLTF